MPTSFPTFGFPLRMARRYFRHVTGMSPGDQFSVTGETVGLRIVAGFLEKNETPENGALREVKEELGLDGEIISFVGHYAFRMRNQIIFAYHIRAEGKIVLGDELESIKAVPPEEVRPWSLGTGPALKDWLASRVESA